MFVDQVEIPSYIGWQQVPWFGRGGEEALMEGFCIGREWSQFLGVFEMRFYSPVKPLLSFRQDVEGCILLGTLF